jgi:uncharacterized membrane protein
VCALIIGEDIRFAALVRGWSVKQMVGSYYVCYIIIIIIIIIIIALFLKNLLNFVHISCKI